MSQTLKFGNKTWATKVGSTLAYNDENGNYKPLPFAFTRSTSATRVNKDGLIEVVTNDRPRIDYTDTSDGVLLLEKAATNLITYSEDFSNAAWDLFRISVTTENYLSPNGSRNVKNIIPDISNNTHGVFDFVSVSSGTYTSSVFLKANGYNFACVRISVDNDTKRFGAVVDLTNGDVTSTDATGSPTSTSFSVNNYGNGWYRLSVSCSHSSGSVYLTISPSLTSNPTFSSSLPSFQGDGTSGVLVFGAQLELGNASSYIPTQGSASTRVAETASGSGNSEVFNDSEGVLMLDINYKNIQSAWQGIAITNDNDINNRIFIGINSNTKILEIYFQSGGSLLWQPDFELSKINQFQKIALKYKANDLALFVNGFEVATNNSVSTMPIGLSLLGFFGFGTTQPQYGSTKEIGYYDTILTDLELETLTSYKSWTSMVNELNLNIIYNG